MGGSKCAWFVKRKSGPHRGPDSRKSHTEIVTGDELGVLDVNAFEVMRVAERKDLDEIGDEVIVEHTERPTRIPLAVSARLMPVIASPHAPKCAPKLASSLASQRPHGPERLVQTRCSS